MTYPDFGISLYGTLNTRYDVDVSDAEETLETFEASDEYTALLDIPTGSPVVRIRRDASDTQGRIVEHAVDLFAASRIRFTLKATGYVRLSAAG